MDSYTFFYILRLLNPYELLRLNWNGHQVDWSHCITMWIIKYRKYKTV